MAGHQFGDLAWVEAAGQLGAHVEQATQLAGEVLGTCQQPGRPDRRCRLVGEDREEPQVVRSELTEAELRERDDPDRRPVVAHRDDQHRLVDVVRPDDRHAARVTVRVLDEQRLTVLGDPAGETLAEGAGQQLHVDLLVCADTALEGDRDDLVRQLDQVDPGVVVIDDPARLLDDRPADLGRGAVAAHPGGRRLEDLELGGARLGLLEQLGVGEGDGRVRGQGRDERHVAARPIARLARDRGQRAQDPVVVDERRDQMAGDLERGVVRHRCVELIAANVGVGEDVPGTQDLADPALVASEDRQLPGQLVREAGPRRDLEGVVVQDPDRGGVGAEGPSGLVHDHPEQVGAIVRGGQASGDAEDGVETLGELGLEGTARWRGCAREGPIGSAGHCHVGGRENDRHAAIGSGQPADEGPGAGDRRSVSVRGAARHPAPGRGIELLDWARAHVSMVALRTSGEVPPTVLVTG